MHALNVLHIAQAYTLRIFIRITHVGVHTERRKKNENKTNYTDERKKRKRKIEQKIPMSRWTDCWLIAQNNMPHDAQAQTLNIVIHGNDERRRRKGSTKDMQGTMVVGRTHSTHRLKFVYIHSRLSHPTPYMRNYHNSIVNTEAPKHQHTTFEFTSMWNRIALHKYIHTVHVASSSHHFMSI